MKVILGGSVLLLLVSTSFCFVEEDSGETSLDFLKEDTEVFEQEAEACKCPKHPKPMDCGEVQENGNTESGVYTIWPKGRTANCPSIEVYCDMETDGGGWLVIQRRGQFGNGKDYFSKDWNAYKTGFGNVKREFWIGNENIHTLTNQAEYSVRFDLTLDDEKSGYTVYESFWIEDEEQKYRLHLSDYSGTAGDAIGNHNGKAFYTRDQPNKDPTRPKDEKQRKGGWWLNAFLTTNLNALNLYGTDEVKTKEGIAWYTFGGSQVSMKATEIKIRSKNH